MKINFFEEFPSKKNLRRAALINWEGALIFLAGKSVGEFEDRKCSLQKINPTVEVGWWPILSGSYWFSPWSNPEELERISQEMVGYKGPLKVLIDLEPPFVRPSLFIKNLLHFRSNKERIGKMLNGFGGEIEIYTAELPIGDCLQEKVLQKLGLNYPQARGVSKHIPMLYSSAPLFNCFAVGIRTYTVKNNKKVAAGLGALAPGVRSRIGFIDRYILGNEEQLSPEKLEWDLEWCQALGFDEVFIFRLGGLNEDYVRVLRRFVSVSK